MLCKNIMIRREANGMKLNSVHPNAAADYGVMKGMSLTHCHSINMTIRRGY